MPCGVQLTYDPTNYVAPDGAEVHLAYDAKSMTESPWLVAVVAVLAPLIRRQAFNVAAELAQHTLAQGTDLWHIGYNRAAVDIAFELRGLGEKENA